MEILNQTNKYIEELGEKVSIQKGQINSTRRGGKKNRKTGEEEDDSDYNEDDDNEI